MSSYNDGPRAPQGRAGVPSGGYRPRDGHQYSDDASRAFDPFGGRRAGGRERTGGNGNGASNGGRANGHGASSGVGRAAGSASVGAALTSSRAMLGRAAARLRDFTGTQRAVPASDEFDPFRDDAPAAGRATVPVSSGRAPVGRASVLAPADPDVPIGPGGPGGFGPGGPGGPGGAGGQRPFYKIARRIRRIIAALAILIMLTGIGVITGVYYTSTITLPADVPLQQSTTLYYSDGKTVMARIGDENRTILADNQIPPIVKQAVTAAEDVTFYSNSGVDFKGIARAFVNNITGGSTQGASTITQQYARSMAGLTYSASYTRKLKEIVLALKMTQKMSKEQILDNYLNTVPFGRGAYGIEAAAEAYYHVTAAQLKPNQAMVLAGMIKNPNGGVYDPTCGKDHKSPCQTAIDRFNYVKGQMPKVPMRKGYLNPAQIAPLTYPTNAVQKVDNAARNALASPVGFVVHHVMDELSHLKKPDGSLMFPSTGANSLEYGGYQIVTTIDKRAEQDAITAASGLTKDT